MSTIRYHYEEDPTEGTPIEAEFSGAQCLTVCKVKDVKVGSLSCSRCEHYVGNAGLAEKVGDGRYGGVSHKRKIWCKGV